MKIALVQINTTVGDVDGNSQKIIHFIEKAKKAASQLVCFHEMALVGYPPRDLLEKPALLIKAKEALQKIASHTTGLAVLVGSIDSNPQKSGKPLSNGAVWCEDGRIRKIIQKSLLPTYDVFDEARYFEPSHCFEPIPYGGKNFGVTICEDIWFKDPSLNRQIYDVDPVEKLAEKGMDVLINISASPYALSKAANRSTLVGKVAMQHGVPVIYVNQVGGNDELIFDGGSLVFDAKGQCRYQAPFFKEGLFVVDLDHLPEEKILPPHDLSLLHEALLCGLRDYVKKCGFKKVTLGLSGGIDSALTAYLACRALGKKNVLGLIMPSRYSSHGSVADAKRLAKNLEMKTLEISIDAVHRSYEKIFKKVFKPQKIGIAEENIQARIRGNLLMAVSNKWGHLVLSTGNKSELAVGYCTLYGDMSGGLAVISDVPKTLVYKLAHYVNRNKETIPRSSIEKLPSAELKPNQTDQETLPPYELLDGIIKACVEDLKTETEIIALGYKRAMVKKVISMIHHNEYKRRQAAPGLKVTSRAFGMGRRYPIACKI